MEKGSTCSEFEESRKKKKCPFTTNIEKKSGAAPRISGKEGKALPALAR